MRLKALVIALYGLLFLICLVWSMQPPASADSNESDSNEPAQAQRVTMRFDRIGRRGEVIFDHKKHEALLNPYPGFPHKAPEGVACIGCHHSVKETTDAKQFQKCTDCHTREEGNPQNPDDREGYDLNAREAYHRLCISCHKGSNFRTSNEYIQNAGFAKCGECHLKDVRLPEYVEVAEVIPPPDDPPDLAEETRPRKVENLTTPVDPPRGYRGEGLGIPDGNGNGENPDRGDFVPRPDRWAIGFPTDPRFEQGAWYNPYRQNVLKGDYPIYKQQNFLVLTLESDTFFLARRLPLPSGASSQRPDSAEFFGRGVNAFARQNFNLSIEWFNGDAAFKPVDWRFRFSPTINVNWLNTQENGIVNIDVRRGANRVDGYVGFQELFGEVRLGDTTKLLPFLRGKGNSDGKSPYYDTTFLRAGIQTFLSDFRGFIFNDFNLGARIFGQFGNNRYNFNAAAFYLLEKDTNSELNTRVNLKEWRDQTVFIANLYRQDTKWKGYTTQFSFHFSNDKPSVRFDENAFLVRPSAIGDAVRHGIKSYYLGWAGDGHINRLNITHAFYQVFGSDSFNPIAGRKQDINAQQAAVELSVDRDWLRFKGSFFYASGDNDPFDDKAHGFDAIVDIPEFAGGLFSYWVTNGIRLLGTGVGLKSGESLLPTLRSSKFEGQANFVNPGIFVYNTGLEAELTPKLRGIANLNYLHFHHTDPIQGVYFQPDIRREIGIDAGLGFLYRPFLNENFVVTGGISSLLPGKGFNDIYTSNCDALGCGQKAKTLFSAFGRVKFTY